MSYSIVCQSETVYLPLPLTFTGARAIARQHAEMGLEVTLLNNGAFLLAFEPPDHGCGPCEILTERSPAMSAETTVIGVVPYGNHAWEIQLATPEGDTRAVIVKGASRSEVERMAAALPASSCKGEYCPGCSAPLCGAGASRF